MAVYRLGDMIRMRREALGMTQEELIQANDRSEEGSPGSPQLSVQGPDAEDGRKEKEEICSIQTLRRAENGGVTRVKARVYRRLMRKMGVLPERIYASILVTKSYALRLKIEIHAHINQGEYETAERKLEELETMLVPGYPRNEQYQIAVGAKLAYRKGELGAEEYLAVLQKALRLTVPMLDEIDIAEWPFNMNEFDILFQIANVYHTQGELGKELDCLLRLKDNIERYYMNVDYYVVWHMCVLASLSQLMCITEQHNKSIAYCNVGVEEGRKQRILGNVFRFLYDIVWNQETLISKGKGSESGSSEQQEIVAKKERTFCKKMLVQGYYLSVAQGNLQDTERIKRLYEHYYPNATKLL